MMRAMRSRTSCDATSMFFSSTKVISTCEMLSLEMDRSSSMPATVLAASSILSVTSVSISFGVAPGRRVTTLTVGNSILGKRSTGSRV